MLNEDKYSGWKLWKVWNLVLFIFISAARTEIINSASSFVTNAAAIMNTLMGQQNEKSLHYKRNEIISILVQKIKDKI